LTKKGRWPSSDNCAGAGRAAHRDDRYIIEATDRDLYGVFESEARQRLRGRDESDWPVLATAIGLSCAVWTEDQDFFGTGVAVCTTSHIEIFLKAQAKSHATEED
jgi:hypothetical protein